MTNDKQTVEEAAREWCRSHDAANCEDVFLAGVRCAQEREKVLGERWVINEPLGGTLSLMTEISEDWAWIKVCKIPRMPSQLTDEDRVVIESWKQLGYRAVKVKLVEVESDGR